ENGINVVLDQWDLGLGDDLAIFMEKGLRESKRVLVICTDEYNRKADAGVGGVGYEKMIVTADLLKDISTNKFIPVIRGVIGKDKTPICLSTRNYIDLADFTEGDLKPGNVKIDELLRELHNIPKEIKPPVGKNPFTILPLGNESKPIDVRIDIQGKQKTTEEIHSLATDLARAADLLGWRQLVKEVKKPVVNGLIDWRNKYEAKPPANIQELHDAVDEAVQIISGLIVIALAGVESGRKEFTDQRSLFDLFFDIVGWNYAGRTNLIHLPRALGYVYHSLHGAMCLDTGQHDVALKLVTMNIQDRLHSYTSPLWREHTLMGWTDALGQECSRAWNFLINAAQRWKWLLPIFGSEFGYRVAVIAYYASLNVSELADYLTKQPSKTLTERTEVHPNIPLCFLHENSDEIRKAMQLIISHGDKASILWKSQGITKEAMLKAWPQWQKICGQWLWQVYQNPSLGLRSLPNADLIQSIGS
ncbi:MAG: toll/interleukin-1 receptor domain-containing protein, partial [Deltaproteobacteria bacterium]|nr:toll/interleukin-1 receptor domain-containing protein [Deltaproteobacteria bacterium]